MKNFIGKSLAIIPIGGLIFAFWLISNDIRTPGFCPKLWIVPACYPVFFCFLFVLIAFFLKGTIEKIIFYTGSMSGLMIAVWFSCHQLAGTKYCPLLFGIPLCYASFFTFLILILFYLIYQRIKDR